MIFIFGQVVTTGPSVVRAARVSSRDPSGRRPATSAGERGSVSSTRARGTGVNTVASGKKLRDDGVDPSYSLVLMIIN